MRRLFFSVLALIAVLLTALGLMVFKPSWWNQATVGLSLLRVNSASAVSSDRASPFAKDEPREDTKRHFTSRILGPADVPGAPAPGQPIPIKPAYSFPREPEVAVGTSKSDVLAAFGQAQATVTGADLGQLYERLLYVDQSSGEETLIVFLNGKVRAVRTYRR